MFALTKLNYMEENTFSTGASQPKTFMLSIGYGFILGIALILFGLVLYLTDLAENESVSWLRYVVVIAGIVLAQVSFRRRQPDALMPYGKAFTTGFLTALFAAVLTSVYAYIFLKFIDPSTLERAIIIAEERFVKQGLSDVEIDRMMKWVSRFSTPGMSAVGAFLFDTIAGAVISLLTAIFTRKEAKL